MRTAALAAGAAGLAVLALAALPAAPARADAGVVDRTLQDARIGESSGLVASRRSPGVLWTHNDSGNPPLLYAIGRDGATVATARVSGTANVDWEALAPLTAEDGAPLLAIGDIGDNPASRSRIEIDVVAEPGTRGTSRISPLRVLRLTYPDGAKDAETLLADPRDGRLYVVSKGLFTSTIYAVPAAAWPGEGSGRTVTATLQPVGRVNLTLVTDGAVLPDGRVLLRTYGRLAVLAPLTPPPPGRGAADVPALTPLAETTLPVQQQGEGLAVADPRAGVLLLSSEGVRSPVVRFTVPPDVWSAGAAAAASSPPSTTRAGAPATPPPPAGATTADAGPVGWLIPLAGGLLVVAALVTGLVLNRLRRAG